MQKLVLQATCWQTLELEGRSGNKVRSDKSTWSKQCMKRKANSIVCWLGWHDGCWGVYRVQFSRPIKLPPCVVILGFVAWWSSILLYENGHVAISPCSQVSFSTIDSILCVCVCVYTYSDASLACYKSMYALALRLPASRDEPYEKLLHVIRETLKSIIALQPQTWHTFMYKQSLLHSQCSLSSCEYVCLLLSIVFQCDWWIRSVIVQLPIYILTAYPPLLLLLFLFWWLPCTQSCCYALLLCPIVAW